jgi:hypothetical protein
MADYYMEQLQQLDKPWFYRVAWIGGTALFILAGYLWWNVASVQPNNVFWGTINNNLVITGVTKKTITNEENGSLNQYQQVSLGSQNVIKTIATVEQKATDAASTKVITESIATPNADFARYTSIQTSEKTPNNQPLDFGTALNVWSKNEVAAGGGTFSEALYGLFPLSFIQGNQRQQIVKDMQKNKVYEIKPDSLKKHRQNGRLIYDYTIAVNPEQYVKSLKAVDAASGLNQLKDVDPSQYAGSQAVEVQVSIDAHAQQLVSITYPDNSRQEEYSGYGIFRPVTLPENAIKQTELQEKLNRILNAQ